ncbi:phosphate butyryltransferase [Saccharicrinis carchari]|uniref:Phosphate butyryltransferase n=1 Tax=Saccharicrinis carchari TaxID=1168039 RepID=A0A521EQY8_SACCC|nr:phosphate acyltransferase [Saccharicrinis carchari]SMO85841.1 phosphate butyryltransferase [Saccharicrinis carchari]
MDHPTTKLAQIPEFVIGLKKRFRAAVVAPEDTHTLEAVVKSSRDGFIYPILIGDSAIISNLLPASFAQDNSRFEIVACTDKAEAAKLAVAMVKRGEADIVMKGLIRTDLLLKAVLDKKKGLMKPQGVLSYVCAMEIPAYPKLLLITDPAVLPFPNLQQKVAMAKYAVEMAHNIGITKPKIALMSASEKVSPHFPNSQEYQTMCKMTNEGEIGNCIMDGPLDLFLACNPASVALKGSHTPVAGDADILLFPSLEASNPFYKSLMLFGGAELAGLISGTTHPVVVMSRSDSFKTKYYCLALACLLVEKSC